ncbi:MAG: hypothetical protein AAGF72_11265 [Pseudomonadota bacterium]
MELDELKTAWQQMDQELQKQQRITAALIEERTGLLVQSSLKPLFRWQVFQILVGIVFITKGAGFWVENIGDAMQFASGVIVHIYGVALIANAAWIITRIKTIDYGTSVTELQKRVAKLEKSYVISGWIIGLPWWLLWIPVAIVLLPSIGVDITKAPPESWLTINLVIGVAGMAMTLAWYAWARRSKEPGVRERLERSDRGASIERARQAIADVERFEREAG